MSRRRTISGLESLPSDQTEHSPQQPVQHRPEPRPRSIVATSITENADGTATLKKKHRPVPTQVEAPTSTATTVVTMTTGSDTIRRKPRTSEQAERVAQSSNLLNSPDSGRKQAAEPQQNGGVVLRRRPVSEATERTEATKESCEWMEARKSLKPPVSPKPSAVNLKKADPPTPTRRVPIPGPDTPEVAQSPGETHMNNSFGKHQPSFSRYAVLVTVAKKGIVKKKNTEYKFYFWEKSAHF